MFSKRRKINNFETQASAILLLLVEFTRLCLSTVFYNILVAFAH